MFNINPLELHVFDVTANICLRLYGSLECFGAKSGYYIDLLNKRLAGDYSIIRVPSDGSTFSFNRADTKWLLSHLCLSLDGVHLGDELTVGLEEQQQLKVQLIEPAAQFQLLRRHRHSHEAALHSGLLSL